MPIDNKIRNINSHCQVVIFNWKNKYLSDSLSVKQLSESEPLDISKYILECSFTKSMSDPAGSFQITLPNNKDWKKEIQVGSWGLIYMSQDYQLEIPKNSDIPDLDLLKVQNEYLRGLIYIERVAPKGMVGGERGEFDIQFQVSGRDFGIVYQETEIFYNRLYSEGILQEAASTALSIASSRKVNHLLKTIHHFFFHPYQLNLPGIKKSLQTDIPTQWLLPEKIFQVLGLISIKNDNFYGSIVGLLEFEDTECSYPVDTPFNFINGKAWDKLRSASIEPFHELFTELNDIGQPRLTFRYIPWKSSNSADLGKLKNKVKSLSDLDFVSLSNLDIMEFDLGEDAHSRYNYFLVVTDTARFSAETSYDTLRDKSPRTGFPRIQENSIRRHGLRLLYQTINANIVQGSEKVDVNLLFDHNKLLLDYYNNAVFLESGSMTIIGNIEVKLGKALYLDNSVPYNDGKIFYIEGYTDIFSIDENGAGFWTQSLVLTRGQDFSSISANRNYFDKGEFTEDK